MVQLRVNPANLYRYMAFQVIQVFLVTTFASGAASVVTQIIDNPSSATTLLAENLPKASNFYISYFILQGLGTQFLVSSFLNFLVVHRVSRRPILFHCSTLREAMKTPWSWSLKAKSCRISTHRRRKGKPK